MPPASDPEPDSVSAKAAICSPRASGGRYLRFWSSLPASQMGRLPSDWTLRIKDDVAQDLLISSTATIRVGALPLIVAVEENSKLCATSSLILSVQSLGNMPIWLATSAHRTSK